MRFAAIDLGGTDLKSGVADIRTGRLEHVRRSPFPRFAPPRLPGFREMDPLEIVDRCRDEIERLSSLEKELSGVLLCGQMHGLVLADDENRPLSPCVSWQDERSLRPHADGGTFFDQLASRLTAEERRELGNELRPGLPVTTLFWLSETGGLPERAVPSSLLDFVAAQLTGAETVTHATNAAAHGTWDVTRGRWHSAVLAKLSLSHLSWPPVVGTGVRVGRISLSGRSVPVLVPIGDQQSALYGAELGPDELSINIGTGSQLAVLSAETSHDGVQVRPYVDGDFIATITHIPAGRSLTALVRLLTELSGGPPTAETWDAVLQAAERAPERQVTVDLSFFPCATGARGSVSGLTEESMTAGALFRGALESMADSYLRLSSRLPGAGRLRRVVLSGGLARRSPLLRELLARAFQQEMRVAEDEEALRGLLRVATRSAASGIL
jgi:sugar (pentulose or hexulose) kinase